MNKFFTFNDRGKNTSTLPRFVINISVCYISAYGIAKPLVRTILSQQSVVIQDNISMLVGMCLFVGLNYLGQRFFVFKDKANNEI